MQFYTFISHYQLIHEFSLTIDPPEFIKHLLQNELHTTHKNKKNTSQLYSIYIFTFLFYLILLRFLPLGSSSCLKKTRDYIQIQPNIPDIALKFCNSMNRHLLRLKFLSCALIYCFFGGFPIPPIFYQSFLYLEECYSNSPYSIL